MNDTEADPLLDAARGYEALFVPALFAPWTGAVIAAAELRDGGRVLDIACGTGVLARDALRTVGPSGQVIGLDPAPGMIAAAQEVEPTIDWVLGAAEELDFADASFDHVLSQFGAMFFHDREAALAQMYRVLKPGGTIAIAVWGALEMNPAYATVVDILQVQVGPAAADAVRLPFCLGNPYELVDGMTKSGFEGVTVETETKEARFPSRQHMVEAELRGWLPLFDIHLEEPTIAAVLAASEDALSGYVNAGGEAVFPTSAHVISAVKPG